MKNHLNIIKKMLDNFIAPKFEDIINYEVSLNDNGLNVLFLMDGTDEEIEEEIVYECQNILKYYSLPDIKIRYRFTVDGEDYYDYR